MRTRRADLFARLGSSPAAPDSSLPPRGDSGYISPMSSTFRTTVALLLCLLLPLQAGASMVRSAGMSAKHAAQMTSPSDMRTMQLAHAIGVPHQHGAHATHDKPLKKKAGKPAKSHTSQQAKAHCHEGAKCCLMAASALPSVTRYRFDPAIARVSYASLSMPAVAFLTDGPERPPRFLTA